MKVCIPSADNAGLGGLPFGHFGSAPFFVIHDMESGATDVVGNDNQHHAHGACQPLAALGGSPVDAVIVGGIGAGAIMKLKAAGIRVFRSGSGSIEENVDALRKGNLAEISADEGCQHHDGCSH